MKKNANLQRSWWQAATASHCNLIFKNLLIRATTTTPTGLGEPLQGELFYRHRNTIMGIKTKDFAEYENMHVAVLKQCDLYDDEDDLMGTQITGVCWDLCKIAHGNMNFRKFTEELILSRLFKPISMIIDIRDLFTFGAYSSYISTLEMVKSLSPTSSISFTSLPQ